MTLSLIDYLSLLAIVIIGIPHGALDLDLAKAGDAALGQRSKTTFAIYVAIAFISFMAWHLMPTVALGLFLLLSAIHFGRANPLLLNHKSKNRLDALIASVFFQGGLTTIFLPWLYWGETQDIFSNLGANTKAFHIIGTFILVAWLISMLVVIFHYYGTRLYITLIGLLALIYFNQLVTPLFLFSIFFCILHSIPHYLKASNEIGASPKKPPISFLINTFAAWTILTSISIYFHQSQNINSSTLNAIFSVLFALTVPHMILVDWLLPKRLNRWKIA